MLRIHFTAEDVARVRIARRPDALWEVALSLHLLQSRAAALVFDPWRREVAHALRQAGMAPTLRALSWLNPLGPYFPDFLTPVPGAAELDEGLDAVLRTPRSQLHREMTALTGRRRAPEWARRLAEGDPIQLRRTTGALRAYHRVAVAPYLPWVRGEVEREAAARREELAEQGVRGLLDGLAPLMRWRPPVLEVEYPVDRELHLAGRGLLLLPSFFCVVRPVAPADPGQPPVLVYPVEHDLLWSAEAQPAEPGCEQPLTRLLGTTRAAVLETVADGSLTTTEVARRTGISPATASHHTSVLREARLITTQRDGNRVQHALTHLGHALLEHPGPAPAP